jgi:hypothetical protein
MALPVTIPNEFANATASIPLSQLDTNFTTLANAVNGISDGSETLANVTATVVNATTVDTTNIQVTNIKAKDGTAAGSIADSTGVVTLASSVLTTTDINGGTIDGAVIGGASAAAGSFTTLNTSGAVVFNDAGADVDFRVEGDTDANLLFVDASTDRVGIGTSSPAAKLYVNSGATAEVLRIEATTNPLFSMFNAGTREFYIQTQSVIDVWGQANKDMRFGTNDAERMRIDSSGNLLVGTTSINGSSSNTVDIVGGNFKTFSNSGSIAGSTTATVLTLSSSVLGVYIVQANFGSQANEIYTGMLIIAANANSFRIVTNGSGTNSVMTLSGANVQLANAIGSALDFTASAIFIGS